MFGPGSMCASSSFALGLESWQRRRQLLEERSGGMEAPAGELLRKRLSGAEPGRREDARARPRMSSRKTFERSGLIETITARGSRSGRKWCSESSEERQVDSPVAGPPLCLAVCAGRCSTHRGNPMLWMHLWMKEFGVSGEDRLYHEGHDTGRNTLPRRHV